MIYNIDHTLKKEIFETFNFASIRGESKKENFEKFNNHKLSNFYPPKSSKHLKKRGHVSQNLISQKGPKFVKLN